MKLTTANGPDIENPSPQQIGDAVRTMAMSSDDFVILQRDDDVFMQAAGERDDFHVEYHLSPDTDEVFEAPKRQTLAMTIELLQLFASGGERYQSRIEWVKAKPPKKSFGCLPILFGVLPGAIALFS